MTLIRFIILFCCVSLGLYAQDVTAEFAKQSEQWEAQATQTQSRLEKGTATDNALEFWRKALVDDRSEAQAVVNANQPKVDDLKAQLATIDATQTTAGASEALTAQRNDLNEQLSSYETPLLTAQIARKRADSLIVQIDEVLRTRFTNSLTSRTSSPLFPGTLATAAADSAGAISTVNLEISNQFAAGSSARKTFFNSLPFTLLGIVIGILLVGFVPSRLARIHFGEVQYRFAKWAALGEKLIFHFGALTCYILGLMLIFGALDKSNALGIFSLSGLNWISYAAFGFVLARWAGVRENDDEALQTQSERFTIGVVGFLVALNVNMEVVARQFTLGPENLAVTNLLLMVIAVPLILFIIRGKKMGRLFPGIRNSTYSNVLNFGQQVLKFGLILAVLLSISGYYGASTQLFQGLSVTFIISLFVYRAYLSLVTLIQTVVSEPKNATATVESEAPKLWPVLLGTALIAIALPILAIFWGMRVTQLQELWIRINDGFSIGDVRVSAVGIVEIIIVFFVLVFIVRAIQRLLQNLILPRSQLDIGAQTAFSTLFSYAGYTLAFFIAMNAAGIKFSSLAVVLGALSVGIGFGLQNIVSNFVSGIILLVERPIKKGDWITVSGHEGYVREIAVRSTVIETFDSASVIVPNADLVSQPVLNWVHSNKDARVRVPIGVGYEHDPREVERLLYEVAQELPFALRIPQPKVMFLGFGDSALNFEMRFFIREADDMVNSLSQANFAIFDKFKKHKISIPFPQRVVTHVNASSGEKTLSE